MGGTADPGGVEGEFDGAVRCLCSSWWMGRKEWSDRWCWEGETWEPPQRPKEHPLSPSTHLPLESGMDRQIVMTEGAIYGALMTTPYGQDARCGAPFA